MFRDGDTAWINSARHMEIKLVKLGFMLTIDNMLWNYLISKNP